MISDEEAGTEQGGAIGAKVRVLRSLVLLVLFPIILLMNACSLVFTEQRDVASSGMLTAKVILLNPGAMSDYTGTIWILPRYLPNVWPLDLLVGCRALIFESDPRIALTWEGSTLAIEHDRFTSPAIGPDSCYGRTVTLRERTG